MSDTDAFAGDSPVSNYDYNAFYVRSTNSKGFDKPVRTDFFTSFPPELTGELNALIARQVFPEYRTSQDFIRDAVVHHLHRRQEEANDPNFTRASEDFFLLEKTRLAVAAGKANEDTVITFIESLRSERDQVKRERLIELARESAEKMSSEHWRTELLRNLPVQ